MQQPQWLDADEQHAWREYLRATRLLEASLDHDLQAQGLQLSEYEIISMLSEQPDQRLRMSEIADSVLLSRSSLSAVCPLSGRALVTLRSTDAACGE